MKNLTNSDITSIGNYIEDAKKIVVTKETEEGTYSRKSSKRLFLMRANNFHLFTANERIKAYLVGKEQVFSEQLIENESNEVVEYHVKVKNSEESFSSIEIKAYW